MKPKKKINILIIEDNRLFRDGISVLINKQTDLKVCAAISDRGKLFPRIFTLKPDVILIDLGLRSQNSLETVTMIKQKSPEIKIIVMGFLPVDSDILNYVKAGASGFILKDTIVHDFLKTIRSVAAGEKVLPPHMMGSLFSQIIDTAINNKNRYDPRQAVVMTKRERQVVELIAEGLTNKEIGQNLNLSPYTVKSHVHNILEKMALQTRLQIARYAYASNEFKDTSDSAPRIDD
jgi:DNA-binding NarL/FixJ family response regulator